MAKKRKQLRFCINPKTEKYDDALTEARNLQNKYLRIYGGFPPEYYILRTAFPYGFIQDAETGAVVFFNRDYEILEFAGQKEFHIDVESVLDADMYSREGMFLLGTDGSVRVGTFHWFYGSGITPPYYFDKPDLADYFKRISRVMVQINDIVPNAWPEGYTLEQQRLCNRKMDNLIKSKKS